MASLEQKKKEILDEMDALKAELVTATDQVAVAAAKVRLEIIKEQIRLLGLREVRTPRTETRDKLSIVR